MGDDFILYNNYHKKPYYVQNWNFLISTYLLLYELLVSLNL